MRERSSRVLELDVTRGAAMVAVILSHSSSFLQHGTKDSLGAVLFAVGMVATPTFLLLSGAVCGHLGADERRTPAAYRSRLLDRGLFLLVVVHLALGLTHALWQPLATALLRSFYITDAVGVCLLFAALVGRLSVRRSLAAGALLFVASSLVGAMLTPQSPWARTVLRVTVGLAESDQDEGWIVPALPYLGVFLIGMAIGKAAASRPRDEVERRRLAARAICVGVVGMAVALFAKLSWFVLSPHTPIAWQPLLFALSEPRQKLPPGPAYVIGFGGAGCVLAGLAARLVHVRRAKPLVDALATVGRASLFVFVVQYGLTLLPASALGLRGGWPVWLVGVLVALFASFQVARRWDRANGNRWLTLGLAARVGTQPTRQGS